MLTFRDINNDEYQAQATVQRVDGVNGEKSLTAVIYFGEDVKTGVSRGWSLVLDGEEYVVTTDQRNDEDNTVEIAAVQRFFWDMQKCGFYEEWNGSHPFTGYLDALFSNMPYSYENTANVAAFEKENWGMNDRLTLFNDVIDQAGVEFYVDGTVVRIKNRIGSDLSTIVRKSFNLDTAALEADNSGFATYGRGFGKYNNEDDHSQGRLEVEYRSPLYDVYAPKFGAIELAPVVDERYTISDNLLAAVKKKVDESYAYSLSLELVDLQNAGYPYAMANAGDSIMVIDEALNFADSVRIVKVTADYAISGDRTDVKVECGNLSFAEQQKTTASSLGNIVNGLAPIPNAWLTQQVQLATNDLLSARTELQFTDAGIIAVQKNDHNKMVLLNSSGVGVSTDGGQTFQTAITADGVVADRLYGNLIKGINFQTTNADNGFAITLTGGHMQFTSNGASLGTLTSAVDAATNIPDGIVLANGSGQELDISQGGGPGGSAGTYNPIFRIPKDSTYNDPRYKLFGHCRSSIAFDIGSGAWINNNGVIEFSATGGSSNQLEVNSSGAAVLGNFTVYNGSKNAAQVTRDGFRATPAYETAENYVGDIGEAQTSRDSAVTIDIDPLVYDIINTELPYQVFVTSYSAAHVWVAKRDGDSFTVKSDTPGAPFGWELKGKRRGYESERLTKTDMPYSKLEEWEGNNNNDD